MSAPNQSFTRAVRRELKALADPETAAGQQAYMKSTMPYYGIRTPDQRRVVRALLESYPFNDRAGWEATTLTLWRGARYREERYAAIEVLGCRAYRNWLDPGLLPLLRELIVSGAWWDFVDTIAINLIGPILADYPDRIRPLLTCWSTDDDIWLRRTAILSQLKFKTRTDRALLFGLIEPSLGEKAFFLRKAIGWALREYSKTNPEAVIEYVTTHASRLSGLSKREALKVLLKQGTVSEVP